MVYWRLNFVFVSLSKGSKHSTPKVGMHLGVMVPSLDCPPFVKLCFTPKHTFLASWAFVVHA